MQYDSNNISPEIDRGLEQKHSVSARPCVFINKHARAHRIAKTAGWKRRGEPRPARGASPSPSIRLTASRVSEHRFKYGAEPAAETCNLTSLSFRRRFAFSAKMARLQILGVLHSESLLFPLQRWLSGGGRRLPGFRAAGGGLAHGAFYIPSRHGGAGVAGAWVGRTGRWPCHLLP